MGMAIEDLTLREEAEARQYGLTNEKYYRLRDIFIDRAKTTELADLLPEAENHLKENRDFQKRMQAEARKALEPELRKEVETDLRPKLRVEIEKDIGKKAYEQALAEVRADASKRVPTDKDRTRFRNYLRDFETDTLAMAETASSYGVIGFNAWRRNRHYRLPLIALLCTGSVPTVLGLYAHSTVSRNLLKPRSE